MSAIGLTFDFLLGHSQRSSQIARPATVIQTCIFLGAPYLPVVTGSWVPKAGLRFSPLPTFNFSTGSPKTAFNRHFCALSDRR
jgi:hypothetical protein